MCLRMQMCWLQRTAAGRASLLSAMQAAAPGNSNHVHSAPPSSWPMPTTPPVLHRMCPFAPLLQLVVGASNTWANASRSCGCLHGQTELQAAERAGRCWNRHFGRDTTAVCMCAVQQWARQAQFDAVLRSGMLT